MLLLIKRASICNLGSQYNDSDLSLHHLKILKRRLRLWSQLIAAALVKYNATLVAVDGGNVLINNNTATLVAMRVNIKETPT